MVLKKAQLYFHNHTELIRFWIAMATALFVILILLLTMKENRRVVQQEAAQLERIVQDLKDDNERQTQLISCLLAIHGDAVAISSEDEDRCRTEATQQLENSRNGINSDGRSLPPNSQPPVNQPAPSTSSPATPLEEPGTAIDLPDIIPLVPDEIRLPL